MSVSNLLCKKEMNLKLDCFVIFSGALWDERSFGFFFSLCLCLRLLVCFFNFSKKNALFLGKCVHIHFMPMHKVVIEILQFEELARNFNLKYL